MAGTIIADFIRADANKLSLNVGNTIIASVNSMGILSNTGNVMISSSGVLEANSVYYNGSSILSSGKVKTGLQPTGAVLQVAQTVKTDTFSTSNTSLTDVTNLSVTMTPTSVNSKFLVFVTVHVGNYTWSTNGGYFGVKANGTLISGSATQLGPLQYGADSGNSPYETVQWTDTTLYSPSSVSPQTFQVVLATASGSYAIYLNRSYNNAAVVLARSFITVMEIAG